MGTFDIKYSEYIPTANPGLAKANIDVDQGHQALFKSLSNLGTAIRTFGTNLQEEKDAADLATLQRQDSEDYAESMRAANEIGFNNPEEDDDGNI